MPDGHHNLTHHKGNQEWIEKIRKINEYHVEAFARFLARLDSIQDGGKSLLDRSTILYGSGISDGNRHTHHDLPVVHAGSGNGKFRTGRHVRFPHYTPMTNLFVTMLDNAGVPASGIGDSSGRLGHLDA